MTPQIPQTRYHCVADALSAYGKTPPLPQHRSFREPEPAHSEILQQPALMFAFKVPSTIIRSATAEGRRSLSAHGRRQGPKDAG